MPRTELNCRRHEDATEWLAAHDPDDGQGVIGDQAADPASMFTQPVVIAAWIAGAEASDDLNEAEFAIERATGQRQLDEASCLMREAAALFMGYYEHHRDRAAEHQRAGDIEQERASLQKATVNLSMAVALKEWLAPEPVPGEDVVIAHAQPANDRFMPLAPRSRPGWWDRVLGREPSNVRTPAIAGLRDPVVVEGLMAACGMADATDPISMATATAFRLQTPDPRFDPTRPVCVNGFLYTPATEALCKTN